MSDNSDKGAKRDQSGAEPVKVVGPSEGRPAAAKPASATRNNGAQAPGAGNGPTSGGAASAARSTSAKNVEATTAPTKGVPAKGAGTKPAAAAAQPKGGSKQSRPTGAGAEGAETQDTSQDVTASGGRPGFGSKVRESVERTATFTAVGDASGPGEPHGSTARPVRRARLSLTRIDPWSVAKVSFLLSIAFAVVTFVAVFITWSVLGAAGVWGAINSVIDSFASSNDGTSTFDVRDYVGMGRVLGLTAVLAVVNVVLLTAVATLGAYLYNMASALLGGVEVTLSEDHD